MTKYILAFLLLPFVSLAQNKYPVTTVEVLRNGNVMQNP
jgi:hypothetical protein